MRKILMASVFAAVPFGAGAADLYGDYSFIQESAPSYGRSVVGHLELSGGWANYQDDGEGIDEDVGRFEGRGRANIPFAGNWNLELETGGVALFQDGTSFSTIGVAGHLWAGWGGVRIGGFGGIDFLTGLEVATGGLEAEVDVGNLTLGIQGNYSQDVDNSDNYLWGVTAWGDLYIASNTKLGIEGRYADIAGGQSEAWGVWGTAEHRFAGSPLSIFARGGYTEQQNAEEIVTIMGGIRVFMDDGRTLQEHDQQVPFAFRLPEFVNYVPVND
jgi:hypothetical protein